MNINKFTQKSLQAVQDCEKIRILREELEAEGATGKLKRLNEEVAKFRFENIDGNKPSASEMVNSLERLINSL